MKKMLTTKPGWVILILAFFCFGLQSYADTEPNNDLATAENAAFGVTVSGSLNQAPVGDLDDYYLIVAPSDGDITVSVDIGAGLAAYIVVYDKLGAGGVQLFASEGNTTSVTKYCMAADTFAVRIDHYQGAGSYSFITSIAGSSIGNDTEDNGSIENVTQFISAGQSVTGHIGYYDTDLGYDEHDYFGIILPEDGNYTFKVIRDQSYAPNFYTRVKGKINNEYTNNYSYGDTTLVTVNCLAADTVYVNIDIYSGCGGYTLSFENTTPSGTTNDIEDNSSIENVSQFISEGESVSGHIGYYDTDIDFDEHDYFGVVLPEDGNYTFKVIRNQSSAPLFYTRVKGKINNEYANNYSYGDTTLVTVNCLAADTVYVDIDRYSGCGGYTLSFENTTPSGTANDNEDNSSIENVSQFISEGESVSGHIGYFDTDNDLDENDYFGVVLTRDGNYTFRVVRDSDSQPIFYARVKDKNNFEYANSYSSGDTTLVTVNCLAEDTVYVNIDQYLYCGGYTLNFSATALTYGNDSGDNETLEAASSVPTSSVNEGHLGFYDTDTGTDEYDYYKFNVVQVPFDLDIKVDMTESLITYFRLYDSAGNEIQNAYYPPGSYNFTRTITVAGDYYVALDRYLYCGSYSLGNFCANAPEVAISADGPTDICPGESVLLTATAGLSAYSWLRNGVEVGTTQIYLASEPGTYVVAGYDVNGCDGLSEEVVIGVFDVPAVSISTDDETTFCEGESITLSATAGFDSYEWSNGASGQTIEVADGGNYTVTATTEDGCDAVSSNNIDVTVLPDSDEDGVCDVDDNCPLLYGQIGEACDDGNANTENDIITEDCECVGVVSFNGSVGWNANCDDRESTVTFYLVNTATVAATYTTTVNTEGDFTIPNVLLGTYDIIVDVPGFLNKGLANVITGSGGSTVEFGNITGGDANDSNTINIADFSGLNAAFGSVEGDANYNLYADFNCSGTINIADFSGLNAAFGQGGANAPLP